jgi:MYXO-CTERM domain-containing protein
VFRCDKSALWPVVGVVALLCACSSERGDTEATSRASEPVTVCASGTTLEGVDVSQFQGTIDWAMVQGSGRSFAFIKATEGTTFTDPRFATNWAAAKTAGLYRSASHYFHPNLDPVMQADFFLQTAAPASGDLPPTLDLEVTDGQSAAVITANAIQWLDHVAAATGVTPILYISPTFVTGTLGSPPGLQNHATLWIASWGVTCPDVPAPFTTWAFWQYSDTGTVPGFATAGSADLDQFNGTLADLQQLTIGTTTSDAGGPDAATNPDAGAQDAGGDVDASSPDAGGTADAGGTPDAGGAGDAGGTGDAGDAGSTNDSGDATDGAQPPQDASAPGSEDASADGQVAPSPPANQSSGCGCRVASAPTSRFGLAAAVPLGLLALRRRKARPR